MTCIVVMTAFIHCAHYQVPPLVSRSAYDKTEKGQCKMGLLREFLGPEFNMKNVLYEINEKYACLLR
jgi:hypothetical protein